MKTPYHIETERLGLRLWRPTDSPLFAAMNSDPRVMAYFPRTLAREESLQFVERIEEHFRRHGFGLYAVDELASGSYIGFIGVQMATFEASFTPCLEIGWRLDHPYWGKGYATEGARACLRYGFRDLELKEVCSFTAEINLPSIAVMKKIGLRHRLNFLHPRVNPSDRLAPHVLYGIARAEEM
ncbi:MAG TPA: GNAT family N-acetyltransferase [Spirochaetia bacterium]|nr:GNAT family N-acetyltransferase [Spirochaetia bacterium]